MQFGPVPLDQALGAVLAHSVTLTAGRLRKGRVLDPADLAALALAGHAQVTVARLGPHDMDEDAAALALAHALVPDPAAAGMVLQAVGTGRVNVLATGAGLAHVDTARIHAVNAVDPAITVATVAAWHRMEPGGMVATIKIIPYGVDKTSVSRACKSGTQALSLARPVLSRAVLIETMVGETTGKGHRVTAERLARLGVTLAPPVQVAHQVSALSDALAQANAALVLILTASATSDLQDVAPAAVRKAGGTVLHFGMPVDPGNLLFLGQLEGRPVIGLPGCAKSPALNGADWVLERLICGVPTTGADLQAMGVGGLLKEIPTRPRPRQTRAPDED